MKLNTFSSEQLLSSLKNLVCQEHQILADILDHLREVSTRKIFLPMGYSSLFDFCVRHLGYSEDQAFRRISALRLTEKLPEARSKINSGELSLSNAAELQKFIRSAGEKASINPTELLKSACSLSKKNLQKELLKEAQVKNISTYFEKRETLKPVAENRSELKITLDEETIQKLKQLQDHHSNKLKDGGIGKLLSLLIHQEYEKINKTKSVGCAAKVKTKTQTEVKTETLLSQSPTPTSVPKSTTRYIPIAIKNRVLKRDQKRCQYPGCSSTRYLQFDHVIAFSKNGQTSESNLQLLCANHNRFKGVQ